MRSNLPQNSMLFLQGLKVLKNFGLMEYIMGLCVVILSPVMQCFTKRMIKKTPFVKCKFRDSVLLCHCFPAVLRIFACGGINMNRALITSPWWILLLAFNMMFPFLFTETREIKLLFVLIKACIQRRIHISISSMRRCNSKMLIISAQVLSVKCSNKSCYLEAFSLSFLLAPYRG